MLETAKNSENVESMLENCYEKSEKLEMVEMITFSFDKFFGIFAWQRTQASSFRRRQRDKSVFFKEIV